MEKVKQVKKESRPAAKKRKSYAESDDEDDEDYMDEPVVSSNKGHFNPFLPRVQRSPCEVSSGPQIIMLLIIITIMIIIIVIVIIIMMMIIIIIYISQWQHSQIQDLIFALVLRFKHYTCTENLEIYHKIIEGELLVGF